MKHCSERAQQLHVRLIVRRGAQAGICMFLDGIWLPLMHAGQAPGRTEIIMQLQGGTHVGDEKVIAHGMERSGGKRQEALAATPCQGHRIAAQVCNNETLIASVCDKNPRSSGVIICDVHRLAFVRHVERDSHFERAGVDERDGASAPVGHHHEPAKLMYWCCKSPSCSQQRKRRGVRHLKHADACSSVAGLLDPEVFAKYSHVSRVRMSLARTADLPSPTHINSRVFPWHTAALSPVQQ